MSGRVRAKKKSDAQRKENRRILDIQKEQERLLKASGLDNKTKVINSSQSLSNSQQRYKQKNAEETGLSYGVLTPAQLKAKYGEAQRNPVMLTKKGKEKIMASDANPNFKKAIANSPIDMYGKKGSMAMKYGKHKK